VARTGAVLFFQLISRRYEHASTVLTSNKSLEEWGDVLGDDVMAAALIDRVLHCDMELRDKRRARAPALPSAGRARVRSSASARTQLMQ
jgi:DNA replication protein DnaC